MFIASFSDFYAAILLGRDIQRSFVIVEEVKVSKHACIYTSTERWLVINFPYG